MNSHWDTSVDLILVHNKTNLSDSVKLLNNSQKWFTTERDSFSHRPTAVTIIAILVIITGVIAIAGGLGLLGIAALIPELSIVFLSIGAVLIVIGIGYLAVSYGLIKGRGWAWLIALILSYIGIALAIISIVTGNFLPIINLAINIVIVYILYRPQVRAFFGKSPNAKII